MHTTFPKKNLICKREKETPLLFSRCLFFRTTAIFYHIAIVFLCCCFLSGCHNLEHSKQNTQNPTSENTSDDNTKNTSQKMTNLRSLQPDATSSPAATPSPTTPAITGITISAIGDCTFGSDKSSPASVNFYAVYNKKQDDRYFFRKVKTILGQDDLTIANFEGTLTTGETRVDKTYAFKGEPSYVNILTEGSIEAVSFANNHCKDYGEQSYSDTIKCFEDANIKYASYEKTAIYKCKGKKVGMVAVNGLLGIDYSKQLLKNGIQKLKKRNADIIIASMHAGTEHTEVLNTTQTTLAHYAVDCGANLVLGHHPHVLQGIEYYKNAYIVYSLGNFCFGGNTNPVDKKTMIYQQTFLFQGKKLLKDSLCKVIPCSLSSSKNINTYQPVVQKGSERKQIIRLLNTYSKKGNVSISSSGIITP